ncbi:hypothetical protein DPEC_G00311330 [Dallia pectoralis]|uniref:Uncharacterized protein n=1 Tax=Dallia pectoralis TaxID=75939 RepID=A0ACC2FB90_DALPE|nr:hypothetical protein DPEC_G00311330 [Dallia pectoralis]
MCCGEKHFLFLQTSVTVRENSKQLNKSNHSFLPQFLCLWVSSQACPGIAAERAWSRGPSGLHILADQSVWRKGSLPDYPSWAGIQLLPRDLVLVRASCHTQL